MKNITSILSAAILSLSLVGASVQNADAGKRERQIAAGIFLGVLGATLIHKSRKRNRHRNYYYRDHYSPRYSSRHQPRRHYYRNRPSCNFDSRYDCNGFLNEK